MVGLQTLQTSAEASLKQQAIARLAWLVGMVLLASGSSSAQTPTTADEAAVRAVLSRMIDAFNAGDFAGVAATYSSSGTMIVGDGSQHTGHAAIEQFFVQMRTTLPNYTRFQATVTSVRFISTDVAVVLSEGGFMIQGETRVTAERFGVQSLIAVRENGQWSASLLQRTRILRPRQAS
jgi:uncharacterized protein (TIGR02246 family)